MKVKATYRECWIVYPEVEYDLTQDDIELMKKDGVSFDEESGEFHDHEEVALWLYNNPEELANEPSYDAETVARANGSGEMDSSWEPEVNDVEVEE